MNPARESGCFEIEVDRVAIGGGNRCQPIVELKDIQRRGKRADRHTRIATLQPSECVATDGQAGRHVGRRKSRLSSG